MIADSLSSAPATPRLNVRVKYEASRRALAARSLANVDRIKDEDKRRQAFRQHLREFPPAFTLV